MEVEVKMEVELKMWAEVEMKMEAEAGTLRRAKPRLLYAVGFAGLKLSA